MLPLKGPKCANSTGSTRNIILHSRKSLLFSKSTYGEEKNTAWTKKNGVFDVTIGAPDRAEICELLGLLILNEVKNEFKMLDFGHYRDVGLAVHNKIR